MKNTSLILLLTALSFAVSSPAWSAECYADYKAKKDNPLRLHYGVIQLHGACKKKAARSEVSARISGNGWTLLNVMSVFGPEGLQQRKENAGSFYLRF